MKKLVKPKFEVTNTQVKILLEQVITILEKEPEKLLQNGSFSNDRNGLPVSVFEDSDHLRSADGWVTFFSYQMFGSKTKAWIVLEKVGQFFLSVTGKTLLEGGDGLGAEKLIQLLRKTVATL